MDVSTCATLRDPPSVVCEQTRGSRRPFVPHRGRWTRCSCSPMSGLRLPMGRGTVAARRLLVGRA